MEKRSTRIFSLLTGAAAMASLALSTNAASIGVNVGPTGAANELPAGTSAGVVPQTNWNNFLGGNSGATQVTDDSGTLLTTTATVSTQWTNATGNGVVSGDGVLMNGGLDGGNTTTLSSTVEGIPFSTYDVYIYFDGGNSSGLNGTYTVDDGVAPQSALGTDNATFNGTFIEDTGSGGNYLYFSGLTGSDLTVSSVPTVTGGVTRAPWNGYQIVESIPEPSTGLLALLGLAGFAVRRRR